MKYAMFTHNYQQYVYLTLNIHTHTQNKTRSFYCLLCLENRAFPVPLTLLYAFLLWILFFPRELGGAPLRKIWNYLVVSVSPACFVLFSPQSLLPWLMEQSPKWPLCSSCLIHLSSDPLWPEWWLKYINWVTPFVPLPKPLPSFLFNLE